MKTVFLDTNVVVDLLHYKKEKVFINILPKSFHWDSKTNCDYLFRQ